ncbi:DUF4214 domain-containing protein [Stutzerimonas nitrititolerans]|uniref:DUF4214 domain-containing protein n=1 Tax=Stutzerimonas nitrititolerans TaxID=2482751 RepID=UPI0028A84DC5|nr:DUF4214 domain-containing protein [Stutzerimonas nitrititolerans]
MATGDIRIDALLALPQASLATNHTQGTPVVMSYSFMEAPATAVRDFKPLDQAQRTAIEAMLNEISASVGITFKHVEAGGILRYGLYSGGQTLADGSASKGEMGLTATSANVWLNWTVPQIQNLDSGYGRQLAIHETAHALGLKHPGEYSQWDTGPYLPAELATAKHTIMSYNGGNSNHLGEFDVLALQYLYGSAGGQPSANVIGVTGQYTTGSYFDDRFNLNVETLNTSIRIAGGEGLDQLYINTTTASVRLDGAAPSHIVYTRPDGSFLGIYLDSVERIHFTDKSVAIDDGAAQAYRLYEAAFNRAPDLDGLGYWIKEFDQGASLESVSQRFITSPEFTGLYGPALSTDAFVTALYQNILDRAPEQSGLAFWVDQLQTGAKNEAQVLASFSESNENKIALSGIIQNGVEYLPA